MLDKLQILRRGLTSLALLALLAACGQKGNLVLPTEPAASQRATLPQALGHELRSVLPLGAASAPARAPLAEASTPAASAVATKAAAAAASAPEAAASASH